MNTGSEYIDKKHRH